MANVWFCSDLHFGHKGIERFRGLNEEENRNRICDDWDRVVTKRDIVYVLGDVCFTTETLMHIMNRPGEKYLVRGNHDEFPNMMYSHYFKNIYGILKYKEFWLSHAPIHPNELRGKVNLHGHVHYATIEDSRYFNCCPENLWKIKNRSLISLQEIRDHLKCELDSST